MLLLLSGYIRTYSGIPVENARIQVKGDSYNGVVYSWRFGEYWKLLMPGNYTVIVSAKGFYHKKVNVIVTENVVTLVNIKLHRNYFISSGEKRLYIHYWLVFGTGAFVIYFLSFTNENQILSIKQKKCLIIKSYIHI